MQQEEDKRLRHVSLLRLYPFDLVGEARSQVSAERRRLCSRAETSVSKWVPPLFSTMTASINEPSLQQENRSLREENQALKTENAQLKAEIQRLRHMVHQLEIMIRRYW